MTPLQRRLKVEKKQFFLSIIIASFLGSTFINPLHAAPTKAEKAFIQGIKENILPEDAPHEKRAQHLVGKVGNEMTRLLRDKTLSLAQKEDRLRLIIDEYVHIPSVVRYIIGRRKIKKSVRKEIQKAYLNYVTTSYTHLLITHYTPDKTFDVDTSPIQKQPNGRMLVKSYISSSKGSEANFLLSWTIYMRPSKKSCPQSAAKECPMIVDILPDGISQARAHKELFGRIRDSKELIEALKGEEKSIQKTLEKIQ